MKFEVKDVLSNHRIGQCGRFHGYFVTQFLKLIGECIKNRELAHNEYD